VEFAIHIPKYYPIYTNYCLEILMASWTLSAEPPSHHSNLRPTVIISNIQSQGVTDLDQIQSIPPSLSTELAISQPSMPSVHSTISQTSLDVTDMASLSDIQELPVSDQSIKETNKDSRYVYK
jgi:hypothetical protein